MSVAIRQLISSFSGIRVLPKEKPQPVGSAGSAAAEVVAKAAAATLAAAAVRDEEDPLLQEEMQEKGKRSPSPHEFYSSNKNFKSIAVEQAVEQEKMKTEKPADL